ncbi:MAG: ROK family protein [Clostridiales bacterium]|nr:ROK family protein [Clostridiales bacterium]MCI6588939.1 ROK family protein [Clostridiales bacterium]MCI7703933.1 ROK family protein [Clostridiales bacterium]
MILSIDIGGTAVKMGLVDHEGAIHARHEASVCFDHYQTPILTTVIREAQAFLARESAQIEGIGVSATGQVDDRAGAVIGTNGKIPHYEGAQIKRDMEAAFGVPVFALNDANAAALGECFAGRAKGVQNVLMVTLGTGVGGGIVLGGKIFGGTRGIAGELGHFTLYQDGPRCPCGKRGCFESYAATTALVRRAKEATGEADMNGRIVFSRAADGDQAMLAVLSAWIDDIAAGISGLVHIFNPQMVLIGGGVSAQEALLIAPLRERVLRSVMPRFAECLQLEAATLGNDAGMIGAARFYLDCVRQEGTA